MTVAESIAKAETLLVTGYTINQSANLNAPGVTGYQARQMDGNHISGDVAAKAELEQARRTLMKKYQGKKGVKMAAQDLADLKALNAAYDRMFPEIEE